MTNNRWLFVTCVLAFGIIQQLARPRNCTVCRLNAPAMAGIPQVELPAYLVSLSSIISVQGDAELRTALSRLKSGDTLKIGPGEYRGGQELRNLDSLTIEAADPTQPPLFIGGGNAWHFSACSNLTVRNLHFKKQTGNGINIDDGGRAEPTSQVRLEKLKVSEIGPTGNHDAIKLSGLDQFTVVDCEIVGWGGQGIDMVGCHHGVIQKCRFQGQQGFSASAGVQTKGGSSDILIEACQFIDAGERPLNIGGSTGLDFFRPKDAPYEAARITARGNRIEGGLCAVAFVGVDGAEFSENTILYPEKWVLRILQETTDSRFAPCRNVKFQGNRIAFRRSEVPIECNIGGGTQAESFRFQGNSWFAADRPERSKPRLPVEEIDGRYGVEWARTKSE